jgi:serine/threonine protein kinase
MDQIPGYRLIDKIGEGGMAIVYKGQQVSLNRPVAIKILQKKLADRSSVLERFNRESLIIARLNNPNIIHIIDRGVISEGMPYFVMEYVEGNDLESAIRTGELDFNNKVDLIIQICKALAYAHKNRVIHRDIKPSNILIDKEGNVKVLDFGIARFYEDDDIDSRRTTVGTVMGTLDFMSPEQRSSADKVTALSDLYSLGVVMYALLSCLETYPADRPESADEIKDRLLKLLGGAHLKTEQKDRASQGITNIKEKFALLDVIKEESHGSVHLYEDRINKKLMVIKKRPSKSSGYVEAKLLTSLRHKHIADILGTSKNRNAFIVVMEYLSGGSLKDRLVQPYDMDAFLALAKQICEGLAFAHRNGVIHGDLRPSNILFTNRGRAKITDFGLDEHYVPPEGKSNWYNPTGESRSIGADILAAGVIFYQMLTGSEPEWTEGLLSLPPDFDLFPIELQAILIRMFSTDKKNRYRSCDEVISDIDEFMRGNLEDKAPEAATRLIEESKEPEPPSVKKVKSSVLQIVTTLFLLFLLIFTALAYLTYTGDIYYCVAALTDIWNGLAKWLKAFLP